MTGVTPSGLLLRRGRRSVLIPARALLVCLIAAVGIVVLGIVVLGTGTLQLSPGEVAGALIGRGEDRVEKIVLGIRVPRLVTAVAVGAALGISGCVFQSISRNALGSPDVIGFTTGAATGAVAQIVLVDGGPVATALAAVLGGLLTALVVYLLSIKGGVTGGYRLVLIGIGVGALLAAANTVIMARGQLELAISAQIWLTGSLNARTWAHAVPVLVGLAVLIPVVLAKARALAVMEMGDDTAAQLGVRVERSRVLLMVAAVALAAVAVAAAGPIAFVALAAPQLAARLVRGSAPPILSSALVGALLVVAADVVGQYAPIRVPLPIGVVTGLLGGLYLLWLVTRTRQV
ncbi:FecCD family ABC transporter permease [Mycetocola reblochoni]|uniref:Ferric enterobactin transport system permease protein FepG (TC 3.A.1.14.2) n=2 Tax=Mycetocola reblochoni TaxID=331618 RepID=A0A1R4JWM5_9MICO|nr:iron chelate uptake ABC transporter family permease subunit [Mycetocola reblochoni]RLP70627.1 Fe(3+)-siderophore ABC transporter permease [Mycetocola reblochoni]SJN36416.1 Ferric enterobactin transport system permease protein FepG (TC 3.A.1.14.2) [Mycetocola reblochoni REB411]